MASQHLSPSPWHYTLALPVELVVPSPSRQEDFLHHPRCSASEVAELHKAGMLLKKIAATLGVSKHITRKVIKAMGLELNRIAHVSYLDHPACKPQDVLRLRAQGLTFEQISEQLSISRPVVCRVYHTLEMVAPEIIVELPTFKRCPKKRVDYLAHPRCPAKEVVRLRLEKMTFPQIAEMLGVSIAVVRNVLRAFRDTGAESANSDLLHGRRIHSRIDYCHHPRCDARELARLRSTGLSVHQVAAEMKVAPSLIYAVQRATRDERPN